MEDLKLYDNLFNENYTDARKSDLIQKVFENKSKALLTEKSETIKMAQGGIADKTYTPYEFLHELLPVVYGRPYVVDEKTGQQYDEAIEKGEKELNQYLQSKLEEYGVNSLYRIDDKELIEEIEIKRRKLISDKSFVTEDELNAYLFCHPELNYEHYVKEKSTLDVGYFINKGLVMIDYDVDKDSYVYSYVYEYLSGNVYKKLSRLRRHRERLTELTSLFTYNQFEVQQDALNKAMPTKARITKDLDTCLFILPKSKFGNDFMISPEDVNDIRLSTSYSFISVFKEWTKQELDKALIKKSRTLGEVHKYFTDMVTKEANENDRDYSDRRKKAYLDGKVILMEFMNRGLTTNCQTRLEYMWNEIYNNYAEPKYYKIPVSCQLNNKFKSGSKFIPNETQIQSLQFMKAVGSGLLAYGVGVGKTASSIMNVSYSMDNNLCKKPLFIVPNATYSKWKMEMFGGVRETYRVDYSENKQPLSITFEDEKKAIRFAKSVGGYVVTTTQNIYGHISHLGKNVVELGNLNEDVCKRIKDYTSEEQLQFTTISELISILKQIPKDYNFDNSEINKQIRDKYDDFEPENVIKSYNNEVDEGFYDWWKSKKNRESVNYDYYEGRKSYIENVFKLTLKEYFEKGIRTYRQELAYVLGTVKKFEDGTIFIATYEALEHLGFVMKDNYELRDNNSLFGQLFNEFSQGDEVSEANYKAKRNLPVIWRDAVYGKIKTKIDIRELGFDYVVFDESHLLKKVFTDSKGIPKWGTRGGSGTSIREDRKYSFGEGQLPSTTALVGYLITRYIQNENNYRNVVHLTATPFTNKPAEIYSMMSLTNRKMLTDSNLDYMEQFFDIYMDISFELIFGNTGVTRKESLLGYKNLPQLRNLIYSMMDYKSGEDANIKRPEKILYPSVKNNIETTLPESGTQDELFRQIKNYQRGRIVYSELCGDAVQDIDVDDMTEDELLNYLNDKGTDAQKQKYDELEKPLLDEELNVLRITVKKLHEKSDELKEEDLSDENEKDYFRVVKGLTLLRAVTLSPYLSMCQKEAGIEPTYRQYIESSPKLQYTIQSIKSIHDYELENNLPKSGCVIYMNIGVNVSWKDKNGKTVKWKEGGFQKIKEYLINVMGYSSEEVSIVSGGMSNEEKERSKNKFLSGKSTILIGSSSISTGIDLQNNASSLFLCSFDWNPTDNEQISGRIHRQGCRFSKVRIVYPMVMNSADPNIFQQLYEKTLRIKNIWDRNDTGNTLDLKDFDVNSLRKGVLDEPEDLAVYWKEEQTEELETLDIVLERRLEDLRIASGDQRTIQEYTPVVKGMVVVLDAYRKIKNKKEAEDKLKEKIGDAEWEYNSKVSDLRDKLDSDEIEPADYKLELKKAKEKLEKVKEKFKDDVYDFTNDPDGRYKFLTYDELGDGDALMKLVNKYITNSDSVFNKLEYNEKQEIYRSFLRDYFPRFQDGKYDLSKDESEDIRIYIDFDSSAPIVYANKWKGAYRGFGKIKENLQILGIEFEEIPEAINLINEEKERINQEKENIKQLLPQKLQEFVIAKEQRLIAQPTIEQRVEEFASMNYILHEVVTTFKEDKAKFVEVPDKKLDIKPKKEKTIQEKIEEAVIVDETNESKSGVDSSKLIDDLKNNSLVVRFNNGLNSDGDLEVVDLFHEEGDFILYTALENKEGEITYDVERSVSEQEAIEYYISNKSKISEEFYDDGLIEDFEQEEKVKKPVKVEKPVKKTSKKELYKDLIEGYELALELESDENKIQLYKDLVEGYELALELEEK
jgi:hypothetical protein